MFNSFKFMLPKKPHLVDSSYTFGSATKTVLDNTLVVRQIVLLFGIVFAVLLAYFVANETWFIAIALVAIIPTAILFSSYPFIGIILWLLVTPLFVTQGNLSQLYVFWVLHRAMVPFTLLMIMFPYLFRMKKEWPIRLGMAELAIAVFLGLTLISVFTLSINSQTALYQTYDRFFINFCLYLIVRFSHFSEKDFKLLVWILVIQVLVQSAVGLAANFTPNLLPERWYSDVARVRTIGTFNMPARYTSFLVFCLVIIFQALVQWKSGPIKTVLTGVFILGSFMVFMSFSKGSWLGGGLALLGIVFIYPKQFIRIGGILTLFVLVFGFGFLSEQITYASDRLNNNSTDQRMVANIAMVNMVQASPLVGWGMNNLNDFIDDFVVRLDDYAAEQNASHNTSLSMMAELGLIAFIIYHLPFIWWIPLTIKAWPEMPKDGFLSRTLPILLWLSILNHFVVGSFSDFRNATSGTFVIGTWWISLGLIAHFVYPYLQPKHVSSGLTDRKEK